jgi:hypothetical protein
MYVDVGDYCVPRLPFLIVLTSALGCSAASGEPSPVDAPAPAPAPAASEIAPSLRVSVDGSEARMVTFGASKTGIPRTHFDLFAEEESAALIHFNVFFPTETGTFTCADPLAPSLGGLSYYDGHARFFFARAGGCTITIDEAGPVGGRVRGRFSGVVAAMGKAEHVVTGSFDVVRAPDDS